MLNENNGFSWGWVIFIVLILWFFVGGGFGFGNRDNNCGCNRVSNCEVQKQGIIDAAKTNYNILKETHDVQDALGAKIDFYGYENLKDQLSVARDEITFLKTNENTNEKFNALSRQLEACCCAMNGRINELQCAIPQRPPFYANGSYFNGGCGCGY